MAPCTVSSVAVCGRHVRIARDGQANLYGHVFVLRGIYRDSNNNNIMRSAEVEVRCARPQRSIRCT